MFNFIVNPNSGRKVSIYGPTGQKVLNNYLQYLKYGGSAESKSERSLWNFIDETYSFQTGEDEDEYDALETQLEQFEKDKASSRQKKMEEAGEFKTILAEKDSTIESLTKKAEAHDNYLNTRKSELLESFSEDDRDQFAHLPLSDIEKLSKRLNTQSSNVPNVPEGRDGKMGEFGGYGSAQEFAQKDPIGFTKHLEDTVDGYIK